MEVPVLNKGFVRLDGSMADDLSVINSARVSFNKRHEVIEEGDDKLITFLMKNRHGTPFEHNAFRFHVKAPIFVIREWQRHRIGSYNEWSARYSELKDDFYIPDFGNVRTQLGKPGAYTFEPIEAEIDKDFRNRLEEFSNLGFSLYQKFMQDGVAKEQARFFVPNFVYTEMYWTVNARSLMNFISLRNAPYAMWEIREYGKAIEEIFTNLMPLTAEAFIQNGRIAP